MRTDEELVVAARTGEPDAFGSLVERWTNRCWDIAWRILHDRDLAADVAQETLLTAWQQLERLDQPASFGGWVSRIARNRALDRLERERRAMPTGDHEALEGYASRERVAAGAGDDPVAALDGVQQQELVWAAAAALGERDASVLDLHLRHGLEPRELAEELGIAPNNAHQVLFRLRKRLGGAIRAWLLWRGGRPRCERLEADLAAAGVEVFGAQAVAVIDEHADGCLACDRDRTAVVAPAAMFSAVPMMVMPAALGARVIAGLEQAGVPVPAGGVAVGDGGAAGSGDGAAGSGEGAAAGSGDGAAGSGEGAGVASGEGATGPAAPDPAAPGPGGQATSAAAPPPDVDDVAEGGWPVKPLLVAVSAVAVAVVAWLLYGGSATSPELDEVALEESAADELPAPPTTTPEPEAPDTHDLVERVPTPHFPVGPRDARLGPDEPSDPEPPEPEGPEDAGETGTPPAPSPPDDPNGNGGNGNGNGNGGNGNGNGNGGNGDGDGGNGDGDGNGGNGEEPEADPPTLTVTRVLGPVRSDRNVDHECPEEAQAAVLLAWTTDHADAVRITTDLAGYEVTYGPDDGAGVCVRDWDAYLVTLTPYLGDVAGDAVVVSGP